MSVRTLCSPRVYWLCLIGLAVLLRVGVMLKAPEQLTEDRDLYLGIAHELQAGHGFATPGTDPPRATAYRPPLYPLLLVLTVGKPVGIACLHLLLTAVMVVTTGRVAARMIADDENRPPRAAILAGGIVAIDPLLVLYSGQPMTETLCSCLTALLLWALLPSGQTQHATGHTRSNTGWSVVTGVLWGLCLLARPTYAAAMVLWIFGCFLSRGREPEHHQYSWRSIALTLLTAAVMLSPWIVRNWVVLGHPIATTTHGGYTLWLANNPVYYQEVVEGADTAWNGDSLNRWQTATNAEMDRMRIIGEFERDRWQNEKARDFIGNNPARFVRACLYRAAKFWSIWPGRSGRRDCLPYFCGWSPLDIWHSGSQAVSPQFVYSLINTGVC